MASVIVTNSCLMIEDYNLGDCPKLENYFKIYDPVTHKLEVLGMYYSSKNKTLYIPRGVDIWMIKKLLGVTHHTNLQPDPYLDTGDIKVRYKPRDEQQEEALKFMIGLEKYDANFYQPQLSVNLPTGKGKTYCSIATISFMRIKSIVITGSNTLLSQWKSNIKEYTDLTEKDILFISGSPMMNMILQGKSKKAQDAKIFLCTHGTIRSFCDTYGWGLLGEVFKALGIGIKFIDEAHTNFVNMLMIDFFTNTFKTFYVTATPARSSWNENKIYQLSMKNVPGIEMFNEKLDPHTDYVAIKFNSKPSPVDISRCKNMYGLDRNKYIEYITRNEEFYKVMRIVMDLYLHCNGRGLFYIGTNEGIVRLYHWIGENYPQLIGDIGIYTSLMSKEDKLREKEKKLLLSTTKSAGLGEHIEHLKMTVVVAEPFKSDVLAKQTLGRTRDDDTMYVELVDLAFKYTRKFYTKKLPVFNRYAASTSDTVLDSYELNIRSQKAEQRQEEKIAKSPIIFKPKEFSKITEEE